MEALIVNDIRYYLSELDHTRCSYHLHVRWCLAGQWTVVRFTQTPDPSANVREDTVDETEEF
jgi:hypothetical protein